MESTIGNAILGVSTLGTKRGSYPEDGSANNDSFWYESKSYYLNWLYLRPLRLRPDDVVYDIGCGAGRLPRARRRNAAQRNQRNLHDFGFRGPIPLSVVDPGPGACDFRAR